MPFDAVVLLQPGPPSVTWWVDDPDDRRVEIDICLPPMATTTGWSFVDLELDPVRHERSGLIEVEDNHEFEEAHRHGWMSADDARLALERADAMKEMLVQGTEPWGDHGWHVLDELRRQD